MRVILFILGLAMLLTSSLVVFDIAGLIGNRVLLWLPMGLVAVYMLGIGVKNE